MEKWNICVIGPARSRTTLVFDVLKQEYLEHRWFNEPGMVKHENAKHLLFSDARTKSRFEVDSLKSQLVVKSKPVLFKMVAGATYFDLTDDDLGFIAKHCWVIGTTRDPVDACVSYLTGLKTRRFFGTSSEKEAEAESLFYLPEEDDARLFWCVHYQVQAAKWFKILSWYTTITYLDYSKVKTAKDVADTLDLDVVPKERIAKAQSLPYSKLYRNYRALEDTCSRMCKALNLI